MVSCGCPVVSAPVCQCPMVLTTGHWTVRTGRRYERHWRMEWGNWTWLANRNLTPLSGSIKVSRVRLNHCVTNWTHCSTRDLSTQDTLQLESVVSSSRAGLSRGRVSSEVEAVAEEEEISYPWSCVVRRKRGWVRPSCHQVSIVTYICMWHWCTISVLIGQHCRPQSTEYEVLRVEGCEDNQPSTPCLRKKGKSKRRSDSMSSSESPTKMKKLKLVLGSETMSVNYSD